ncbi:MAG: general secretion pathway protein GspK [Planctomycetes bacterium]|nr:general secretion pathway protein GspK [Planctomycetota bacterium]
MAEPTQPKPGRPRRDRRGFALLIVMILIILLAVLVFAFQRDVMREISISANVRDDLKAAYLAQMAMVRGQVILRLDDHADYDSLNEPWAQPVSWEGETWGAEDSADGQTPPQPQILITDEERKFNLLSLVRGNETQQEKARKTLQRLIAICRREDDRLMLEGDAKTVRRAGDDSVNTETLVRNLVKYLEERASEDSDDLEITANPNTKPDVRSMKKQTPFEMLTVGELLQVEGWTEVLLYGPIRKADTGIEQDDPNADEGPRDWKDLNDQEKFEKRRESIESIDERSTDPTPLPILGFITLYSTGFINVNTCSRELLLALDEKMTWDVVDQIITAREQDRQDIVTADENGGELPEEEPDPNIDPNAPPPEEEDNASFRPQDLASYQAFVQRVNNQAAAEGEEPPTEIEGFTEEIYNAIRPWLVVRSTVFEVEASATVGKVTHTIRAVYRRTAAAAPAQPAGDTGQPTDGGTDTGTDAATSGEEPLPAEPTMKLTLLFRDISKGG